jgi:TIR domain
MIDVFISHSSADKDIARCLIGLLRSAIPNITPEGIRCTSVPGFRLPGGADADDRLRKEMIDARVFVGLLTEESLASTYVLFELGSRWGASRQLTPLLAAGMSPSRLKAPLNRLNAHSCNVPEHLHQLVGEVSSALGFQPTAAEVYDANVRELVQLSEREGAKREKTRNDINVYTSPYQIYSVIPEVISMVEHQSTGTKQLSIGILHGKTAPPESKPGVTDEGPWYRSFDEAIRNCIESAGPGMWYVREFKNITTPDRLERTLNLIADATEGYDVRAVCIPNLLPCLSPLVIGEEDVFLATMDTGKRRVGSAIHIHSRQAVEFVNSYLALLRDYEPHFTLRTEEGQNDKQVKKLRNVIAKVGT